MADNRIRFDPTLIDFAATFGLTGQAHDTYPAPGQPPRYDWARSYLQALLAHQSSPSGSPPTQYRQGTIWFQNDDKRIYIYTTDIYDGTGWKDISECIFLDTGLTLQQWYIQATQLLASILPRMTFSGSIITDFTTHIPVPTAIQTDLVPIKNLVRPVLYVNGLLKDPRLYQFSASCPVTIDIISGITLRVGDKFTVVIERFDQFVVDEVLA